MHDRSLSLSLSLPHRNVFSSELHSQTHTITYSCTSWGLQWQAMTGIAVAGSRGNPQVSTQMHRPMPMTIPIYWAAIYVLTRGIRDSETSKTPSLPLEIPCLKAQGRGLPQIAGFTYCIRIRIYENIHEGTLPSPGRGSVITWGSLCSDSAVI